MTYTSAIETSGQFANDPSNSISSATAIPASAKTEAITRATTPQAAAIDAIASDSAKVSLAGAMLSQASAGSDVRFDRVAALQQSIGAGAYAVASGQVAGKLIASLQD